MIVALLDTDILSEYFRGNARVIKRVEDYLEKFEAINFSIITYYEILNGLLCKDAQNQLERFKSFAQMSNILPLTLRTVEISAKIHADLRKKGREIGHTDTLIAGTALGFGMQLISNNLEHFSRIEGLELDNWK